MKKLFVLLLLNLILVGCEDEPTDIVIGNSSKESSSLSRNRSSSLVISQGVGKNSLTLDTLRNIASKYNFFKDSLKTLDLSKVKSLDFVDGKATLKAELLFSDSNYYTDLNYMSSYLDSIKKASLNTTLVMKSVLRKYLINDTLTGVYIYTKLDYNNSNYFLALSEINVYNTSSNQRVSSQKLLNHGLNYGSCDSFEGAGQDEFHFFLDQPDVIIFGKDLIISDGVASYFSSNELLRDSLAPVRKYEKLVWSNDSNKFTKSKFESVEFSILKSELDDFAIKFIEFTKESPIEAFANYGYLIDQITQDTKLNPIGSRSSGIFLSSQNSYAFSHFAKTLLVWEEVEEKLILVNANRFDLVPVLDEGFKFTPEQILKGFDGVLSSFVEKVDVSFMGKGRMSENLVYLTFKNFDCDSCPMFPILKDDSFYQFSDSLELPVSKLGMYQHNCLIKSSLSKEKSISDEEYVGVLCEFEKGHYEAFAIKLGDSLANIVKQDSITVTPGYRVQLDITNSSSVIPIDSVAYDGAVFLEIYLKKAIPLEGDGACLC